MRWIILVLLVVLGACGSDDGGEAASTTTAVETTSTTRASTTTARPTTTAPPVTMPNGDPVFDGFPRLVDRLSVDQRVASWFEGEADQLVALAPGVYTPYNPNITDLATYLDGPVSGDCTAIGEWFPHAGGACWDGVG